MQPLLRPKLFFLPMEQHTGICEGRGIFILDYHGEHDGIPVACECCELVGPVCKEGPQQWLFHLFKEPAMRQHFLC